ncbi:hypothetical protein DFS34DRAFT_651647 [Phlyctochytrium arcticum]|nr:hypothetical protein DFS34DRAFT_651647 [Phlyctochytrium arcticum]
MPPPRELRRHNTPRSPSFNPLPPLTAFLFNLILILQLPYRTSALANQTWVVAANNVVYGFGGREQSPASGPNSFSSAYADVNGIQRSLWGDVSFFNKSTVGAASESSLDLFRSNLFPPDAPSQLFGRVGHSADFLGDGRVVLAFGRLGNGSDFDDLPYVDNTQIIVFHTATKQVEVIKTEGEIPRGRSLHTSLYDPTNRSIIVYGGDLDTDRGSGRSDWDEAHSIYILSIDNWTWTRIPPPAVGLVAAALNGTGSVAGAALLRNGTFVTCFGRSAVVVNPCMLFHLANRTWELPVWQTPDSDADIPSSRLGASLTLMAESSFAYLFGGYNAVKNEYLGDLWRLELGALPQLSWVNQAHPIDQPAPAPRAFHVAVDLFGRLGIYGGEGNAPISPSNLFVFSQNSGWNQGKVQKFSTGRPPAPNIPDVDPDGTVDDQTRDPQTRSTSQLGLIIGLSTGGLLTFVGAAVVVRRRTRPRTSQDRQRGLLLQAVSNRLRIANENAPSGTDIDGGKQVDGDGRSLGSSETNSAVSSTDRSSQARSSSTLLNNILNFRQSVNGPPSLVRIPLQPLGNTLPPERHTINPLLADKRRQQQPFLAMPPLALLPPEAMSTIRQSLTLPTRPPHSTSSRSTSPGRSRRSPHGSAAPSSHRPSSLDSVLSGRLPPRQARNSTGSIRTMNTLGAYDDAFEQWALAGGDAGSSQSETTQSTFGSSTLTTSQEPSPIVVVSNNSFSQSSRHGTDRTPPPLQTQPYASHASSLNHDSNSLLSDTNSILTHQTTGTLGAYDDAFESWAMSGD